MLKSTQNEDRLIPIPDWPKYHPWPSVAGMRHIKFNAKRKGFEKAFSKVGKRVLVIEKVFLKLAANGGSYE